MSMLLTLTLPKSMSIQSQEPSDGFLEPSTLALCVCDALQNPLAPTLVWDLGSRTPARKGGGSVSERTWRWSPVHVTLACRRELGLFGGQAVVPQPATLRAQHHPGPYNSWVLSTLLFVSKTMDFPSMKETRYRSPHSEQGKD